MTLTPADVATVTTVDFSGTAFCGSPTWTDVSDDVITSNSTPGSAPVSISWGRQAWLGDTQPSQCSYTLMNRDGTYTPGNTGSPYWPWVRRRARTHVATTIGGDTVDLFDGYWDDPSAVPGTTTWYTQVSATDILGRMGSDTPLRGFLVEEMLTDSPTCLYSLQEPEGSVSFADLTTLNSAGLSVASTVGEGIIDAGQDPGGASASAVAVPLSGTVVAITNSVYPAPDSTGAVKGTYLRLPANPATATTDFTVELWVQMPTIAPSGSSRGYVVGSQDLTAPIGWNVTVEAGGVLQFSAFCPGAAGAIQSAVSYCDGQLHHVVGVLVGGSHVKLYVDGVVASGSVSGGSVTSLDTGKPIRCGLDGQADNAPFTGGYAYLATYVAALSAGRVSAHYTAATTAFAGEGAGVNVTRLVGYRPNLGVSVDTGVSHVGLADCYGESLQSALLGAAQGDGGAVFADGNGQIVFRSRSRLVSPTPVMTLDASVGEVELPSSFVSDVAAVMNDVTVSSMGNADQRVFDQGSIDQDGVCAQQFTVNVETDTEAADLASYLLGLGVGEQITCPSLTCNLFGMSSSAQAVALLQLATLDVVELVNLPVQAPAATMDFVVQGGTMTISAEQFLVTLYVTPVPA